MPGLAIRASRPRELTLKSDAHVEKSPSAYDGVVELAEGDDDDDGVAEPTKNGRQPSVDFGHTHLSVLPQRLLEKKASDADGKQHDKVGDEESPTPILVGLVGETPNIAQSHGQTESGEEELALIAPTVPFVLHNDLLILLVVMILVLLSHIVCEITGIIRCNQPPPI